MTTEVTSTLYSLIRVSVARLRRRRRPNTPAGTGIQGRNKKGIYIERYTINALDGEPAGREGAGAEGACAGGRTVAGAEEAGAAGEPPGGPDGAGLRPGIPDGMLPDTLFTMSPSSSGSELFRSSIVISPE